MGSIFSCVLVSGSSCPHGAHQTPLPMGFSRQEYWSGCHALLQGIFLTQESNPRLLHCRRILYHWATMEAHGMKGQPLNACKAPFKKEEKRVVVGRTKVTCPGKNVSQNWLESKGKRQNSRWSQHSSTGTLLQKYTHPTKTSKWKALQNFQPNNCHTWNITEGLAGCVYLFRFPQAARGSLGWSLQMSPKVWEGTKSSKQESWVPSSKRAEDT